MILQLLNQIAGAIVIDPLVFSCHEEENKTPACHLQPDAIDYFCANAGREKLEIPVESGTHNTNTHHHHQRQHVIRRVRLLENVSNVECPSSPTNPCVFANMLRAIIFAIVCASFRSFVQQNNTHTHTHTYTYTYTQTKTNKQPKPSALWVMFFFLTGKSTNFTFLTVTSL